MKIRHWITHTLAFGLLFFGLAVMPGIFGD